MFEIYLYQAQITDFHMIISYKWHTCRAIWKVTTHVLIYIVKPHLLNFSNSFTHKRLFMIYDNIVYEHQQRIFWCIKLNASLLLYVLNLLNKNFPEWLHFKSEKLKHNILYPIKVYEYLPFFVNFNCKKYNPINSLVG